MVLGLFLWAIKPGRIDALLELEIPAPNRKIKSE
jgi:hypothetical protein